MLKMMKGMLHSSSDRAALPVYLSPSRSAEFWQLLVVQHKIFHSLSIFMYKGAFERHLFIIRISICNSAVLLLVVLVYPNAN